MSHSQERQGVQVLYRCQWRVHMPLNVLFRNLSFPTLKCPNHSKSLFRALYNVTMKGIWEILWKVRVGREGAVVGKRNFGRAFYRKICYQGRLFGGDA